MILVIACGFTGCWLRGMSFQESAAFQLGLNKFSVVTSRNTFYFLREYNGNSAADVVELKSASYAGPTLLHSAIHNNSIFWKWRWAGFGYYHCAFEDLDYALTVIPMPYWTTAITLALLSGWLLLGKPRKKPGTATDGFAP